MSRKINNPVENWTKYPNCILDNLNDFTANEVKILSLMVRKTLGFQNPNYKFSIRYIMLKTGISKPTVINTVKTLLEKQSIKLLDTAERGTKKYEINWINPLVKNIDQSKIFTSTGKKSLPDLVKNIDPLKENKVKENNNKDNNTDDKNKNYIPLAALLYAEHKKHDDNFLAGKNLGTTFARWANDIRLLIENDKRAYEIVENVIIWTQSPGCFWIPNILSGKKLREKFPMLYSQYMRDNKNSGRKKHHDDWTSKYGQKLDQLAE